MRWPILLAALLLVGSASAQMPPGHPPTDMPPGHPEPEAGAGFFRPPSDDVLVDEKMPAGTIDVVIADADDKPIASAPIVLAVKEESVSRGEKKYTLDRVADSEGHLSLTKMKVGSGISYTIKTTNGDATFETEPFGLQETGGIRVRLHAYEPVTDLASAAMVMEATVMLEVKEDSFGVSHRIRTLNVGRNAFVAKGVSMRLPEDFSAFNNEDAGSIRVVERDGVAELEGTFPPGQAEFFFRYQLPLSGDRTQTLRLPLFPRVVHTTVMAGAGPEMKLEVAGFPKAEPDRLNNGQRVLRTVHEPDLRMGLQGVMSDMSPRTLEVTLTGIPTPGPWRWLAVVLSLVGCVAGAAYLLFMRTRKVTNEEVADLRDARDALLDELAQLEKLHRKGDVGPQSYERLRDALLDALARIVDKLDLARPPKPAKKAAAATKKVADAKKDADGISEQPKRKRRKRKVKSATA